MSNSYLKKVILIFLPIFLLSCNSAITQSGETNIPDDQFNTYWYAGDAELSRYEVEQARYGEIHKAEAVLIFVTEEFRADKQVKYEGGDRKNVVPILKLNATKKFFTGIYPYSLMTSVFSPIDQGKTLKVSASSQEWCGHSFYQLNLKKDKYKGQLNSYFQNEGDQKFELAGAFLEDEIWTRIRLNPNALPVGEIDIIPGSQFLRLNHKKIQAEPALASLISSTNTSTQEKPLISYTVDYKNISRKLTITFESQFPHRIVSWKEESGSGFTTKASLTNSLKSPYWGKNGLRDEGLRKELGLNSANY